MMVKCLWPLFSSFSSSEERIYTYRILSFF
jgi:hypothetical protein